MNNSLFPLQLRPPLRRGERDGARDVGRDAILVLQAAARAGRGRGQRRHRRRRRHLHQRLPPRHRVGRKRLSNLLESVLENFKTYEYTFLLSRWCPA